MMPLQQDKDEKITVLEAKVESLNKDLDSVLTLIKEMQMYMLRLGKNQEILAIQLAQWPFIQISENKKRQKSEETTDKKKGK
jgi:hypothetical protein